MDPDPPVVPICDTKIALPMARVDEQKPYYVAPSRARVWFTERDDFPFQIRSLTYPSLTRDTLVSLDPATNHTERFTPHIGKAPLQIAGIVPWRNSLILWTRLEAPPLDTPRRNMHYRRYLIDDQDNITPLEPHGGFKPWLADSVKDVLFSLEVRDKIMGGQPDEYDLPPQRVRIESLTNPSQAPVYFQVRRLNKLFLHPSGDLFVLRWDRRYLRPMSTAVFKVFLDRRTPPGYDLAWSTEFISDQGLLQYGVGPKLTVSYTPDADVVGISYTTNLGGIEDLRTNIDAGSGRILTTEATSEVHPARGTVTCNK